MLGVDPATIAAPYFIAVMGDSGSGNAEGHFALMLTRDKFVMCDAPFLNDSGISLRKPPSPAPSTTP